MSPDFTWRMMWLKAWVTVFRRRCCATEPKTLAIWRNRRLQSTFWVRQHFKLQWPVLSISKVLQLSPHLPSWWDLSSLLQTALYCIIMREQLNNTAELRPLPFLYLYYLVCFSTFGCLSEGNGKWRQVISLCRVHEVDGNDKNLLCCF